MEIKTSPSIGVQKFGIVYRPQAGSGDEFAGISGIVVKLKFFQRIKILLKRLFIKIRERIHA